MAAGGGDGRQYGGRVTVFVVLSALMVQGGSKQEKPVFA